MFPKKNLKKLLQEGKIQSVINRLIEHQDLLDNEDKNEFFLIASRYNNLKRSDNKGMISQDDKSISINKINASLLVFIDKINNFEKIKRTKITKFNKIAYSLLLIITLIFVIIVFYFDDNYIKEKDSIKLEQQTSGSNSPIINSIGGDVEMSYDVTWDDTTKLVKDSIK